MPGSGSSTSPRVVTGDLAYYTAIERSTVLLVNSDEPVQQCLWVTMVCRKEQGSWKIVHRHADDREATPTMPNELDGDGDGEREPDAEQHTLQRVVLERPAADEPDQAAVDRPGHRREAGGTRRTSAAGSRPRPSSG